MVPLILWISLIFSLTISANSQSQESIYEVLSAHGLPMGLLPKGVKEFNIDDKGRFEVHLDQACNAMFESQLHYERKVSGSLSYGKIGALSGISVQELFLWFPVKGIRVDIPSSGLIYFDVGVVFKQFSLSLFESPRDCMAAQAVDVEGIRDGKVLAEEVAKGQSRELRFQLDQERFVRDSLSFMQEYM